MKNIAWARFRAGSCGTNRAASTYRLSRYCGVVGPPSGSDSVKPAVALAPTITIRPQGGFPAGLSGGAGSAEPRVGGACDSPVTATGALRAIRSTVSHPAPREKRIAVEQPIKVVMTIGLFCTAEHKRDKRSIGEMEYWRDGVLERWSIGVMEYWSIGAANWRSPSLHHSITPSLHRSPDSLPWLVIGEQLPSPDAGEQGQRFALDQRLKAAEAAGESDRQHGKITGKELDHCGFVRHQPISEPLAIAGKLER